jgi:hypothetical protein
LYRLGTRFSSGCGSVSVREQEKDTGIHPYTRSPQ